MSGAVYHPRKSLVPGAGTRATAGIIRLTRPLHLRRLLRPQRSADVDWGSETFLGSGAAHAVSEREPDEPPTLYLPDREAGGYKAHPVVRPKLPLGFQHG